MFYLYKYTDIDIDIYTYEELNLKTHEGCFYSY